MPTLPPECVGIFYLTFVPGALPPFALPHPREKLISMRPENERRLSNMHPEHHSNSVVMSMT
jgi:hypothetical protein